MSDQFIAETALDCAVKLNLWNFGVLGNPEVRNESASTASIADMVILSMSGTVPLSAHALAWIEMWIWLIDGRRPAVVALFANHHRPGEAIRACLRRSAVSKNLEFFPVVPRAGTVSNRESEEEPGPNGHQNYRAVLSPSKPRLARNDSRRTVIE